MSEKRETLLNIIEAMLGDNSRVVAEHLLNQEEEVTAEVIAETLDTRKALIRKALYDLEDIGLATFQRKRDKETGWRMIYWSIHPDNTSKIRAHQVDEIEKTKQKLEFVTSDSLFYCSDHSSEKIKLNDAIINNFSCQNCGNEIIAFDATEIIEKLETKLDRMTKLLVKL